MNNRQGPVYIREECGCKVDHGIPTRCNEHKLRGKMNKKDLDIYITGNWGEDQMKADNETAAFDLAQDILVHLKKTARGNMVSELNEDNIVDPIKQWIDENFN